MQGEAVRSTRKSSVVAARVLAAVVEPEPWPAAVVVAGNDKLVIVGSHGWVGWADEVGMQG
jgi:predicted aconitase with swiveling domain